MSHIDLKSSVLGSIVELGRAAIDPEVNPCVKLSDGMPTTDIEEFESPEIAAKYMDKPERQLLSTPQKDKCDYKDCDNCPFFRKNAVEINIKAEYLLQNATILGVSLEEMLDELVPPEDDA